MWWEIPHRCIGCCSVSRLSVAQKYIVCTVAPNTEWTFDIMSTSFFLSRRALKPSANSGMPMWQDRMFIGLAKSASDATDFFQIPTGRVVEVGTQVTI